MKIKIAYIIPTLSLGGAEKQQINILNGMSKDKYEINLFILKNNTQLLSQLNNKSVKVFIYSIDSMWSFKRLVYFIYDIKKFSPDIIHSHMYNANLIARLLKLILPKAKIVNHYHGMSEWISKMKLLFDKITSHLVSSFIVVSEKSYELRSVREQYPKKKLVLLYNSVDLEITLKKKSFDLSNKIIFGVASRLIPLKNIEAIIYLVSKLYQKGLDVKLLIAGDGPELDNLKYFSQIQGIKNRVEFLGFVDNMNAFYEDIDIYCISSKTEDLPLSVIEAMMSGKPIISSKVGGIPAILKNIKYTVIIDDFYLDSEIDKVYELLISCENDNFGDYLHNIAFEKFNNTKYCVQLEKIYNHILKGV